MGIRANCCQCFVLWLVVCPEGVALHLDDFDPVDSTFLCLELLGDFLVFLLLSVAHTTHISLEWCQDYLLVAHYDLLSVMTWDPEHFLFEDHLTRIQKFECLHVATEVGSCLIFTLGLFLPRLVQLSLLFKDLLCFFKPLIGHCVDFFAGFCLVMVVADGSLLPLHLIFVSLLGMPLVGLEFVRISFLAI